MDEQTMALVQAVHAVNQKMPDVATKLLTGEMAAEKLSEFGGLLIQLGELMRQNSRIKSNVQSVTGTNHNDLAVPSRMLTLQQAHDLVARTRPDNKATPATWSKYRRVSSLLYQRVAKTDQSHRHEALY